MDASAYGAGSPLTVIFVIPFIVIIVVGFFAMSLLFFVYRARAVVLGGILAVLYGLPLYGLVPNQFHQLSSPCCGPTPDSSWALFAAESVPLVVGLAGGVWGFLAKTSAMVGPEPGGWSGCSTLDYRCWSVEHDRILFSCWISSITAVSDSRRSHLPRQSRRGDDIRRFALYW